MEVIDRFLGCLLGLAVGDAVGTAVEFSPRKSFIPLDDMTGGGPFGLEPGQWTDDTSMALCLGTSLVEMNGFDPNDQMERYCRWFEEGYLSSTGKCFDIGTTTLDSLQRYRQTGNPFSGSSDPYTAGNGSIMRLAPIPMFYFRDFEAVEYHAAESSRTTHGATECLDACRLFSRITWRALKGMSKENVLLEGRGGFRGVPTILSIARGEYTGKDEARIRGSGYVVESLEAALWCFYQTSSFEESILAAANLGDDADTTAAVCGQVAGAYYGRSGIPGSWINRLARRDLIYSLAEKIYQHTLIK